MTQINLLPWREEYRQTKRKQFMIILGCFVALSLFFVFIFHLFMLQLIDNQLHKNTLLQDNINHVQTTLTLLNKKKKEELIANSELRFIFSLQEKSYRAVQLLDELVKVVPQGITLNQIIKDGDNITISGLATTNLQVTLFMKNLSTNAIFNNPVLTDIDTKGNSSGEERHFQLKVQQQETKIND